MHGRSSTLTKLQDEKMRWNKPEYQRISSVTWRDDEIIVLFEDGSWVSLKPKRLLPPDIHAVDWKRMSYGPFEITVPTMDDTELRIPWSTIRALADKEFSRHLATTAEEQARQIGLRIKELRESRNISGKDLAERAGITPQSLSRIENGHHDVVFRTLRRILAAMGCSLKDLVANDRGGPKLEELLRRLSKLGIDRDIINRLLPRSASRPGSPIAADSHMTSLAKTISRVYGWSVASILGGDKLSIDLKSLGVVRFKKSGLTDENRSTAYAVYAHYLAALSAQATPRIKTRALPNTPSEIRTLVVSKDRNLTFMSLLSFAWEHGVLILPLRDPAAFHGATFLIGERVVIVLKQMTLFQARWLYDLSHELGHAVKHLSKSRATIIEAEEISPFSDTDAEREASDFATELVLFGRAEELAQLCVNRARNRLQNFKVAVAEVATNERIPVDTLANYMAFRLSKQGENWWGAANNLQVTEPSPWELARAELMKRIDLKKLNTEDRMILIQALAAI